MANIDGRGRRSCLRPAASRPRPVRVSVSTVVVSRQNSRRRATAFFAGHGQREQHDSRTGEAAVQIDRCDRTTSPVPISGSAQTARTPAAGRDGVGACARRPPASAPARMPGATSDAGIEKSRAPGSGETHKYDVTGHIATNTCPEREVADGVHQSGDDGQNVQQTRKRAIASVPDPIASARAPALPCCSPTAFECRSRRFVPGDQQESAHQAQVLEESIFDHDRPG